MTRTLTFASTAFAVALLAAGTLPGDKLQYGPAAGSTLERVWTIENEVSLDDLQMTMNGQPAPMPGDMEMNMSMTTEIAVTDQLVELRPGAPKVLKRSFDKLTGDGTMTSSMPQVGDQEQSLAASSELTGKRVKFVWNEEDARYDASYDESEGDAKLLENIEEDMDLRGLLPTEEVSAGSTWEPTPNSLRGLIAPGGNLKIKPDKIGGQAAGAMGPGMGNMGDMNSMMIGEYEGEVKAEYKGIEEKDGGRFGVIRLTFDVKSSVDLTEEVEKMGGELPEGMGTFDVDHMDAEFTWKGEATLLWDVAAGHIHSADATGEVLTKMDMAFAVKVGNRDVSIESAFTMSGKISSKLEVSTK